MPARAVVTARQRRLGAELRKLRERAGLASREAARTSGIAESKLSWIESGKVGVSPERVRHLAQEYACADADLVESLAAMARERGRGWWAEFEEALPSAFLDLAEMEHHSAYLRTFESVQVPGLLQTEEHVRAIYSASVPQFTPEQVETRTSFRLTRQAVLERGQPFSYQAVIHEAALRVRVADRGVARRQLVHIIEQSERPGAVIRVVPFDTDGFTRIGNPLLYAGGATAQLDTVLVDSPIGGSLIDAEAQLARYRRILDDVEAVALDAVGSRDLIHRLSREL